jgi:hypothetical protein
VLFDNLASPRFAAGAARGEIMPDRLKPTLEVHQGAFRTGAPTDVADPTHGSQQFSFFNGANGPAHVSSALIFERPTGCRLAAGLRPGTASSHSPIVRLSSCEYALWLTVL